MEISEIPLIHNVSPSRQRIPGLSKVMTAVQQIDNSGQQLAALYSELRRQEKILLKAGVIHARTVMKQGKYLYLVFPAVDGKAKTTKYIGVDPEAIAQAKAAITRGLKLIEIQAAIKDIELRLRQSDLLLRKVMQTLRV